MRNKRATVEGICPYSLSAHQRATDFKQAKDTKANWALHIPGSPVRSFPELGPRTLLHNEHGR